MTRTDLPTLVSKRRQSSSYKTAVYPPPINKEDKHKGQWGKETVIILTKEDLTDSAMPWAPVTGSSTHAGDEVWVARLELLHLQVLLCSWLRQAGSNGLMCCSFCASTTWILGTKEAGGLCTLCSSAVSVHSIGSRSEASLRGGAKLQYTDDVSCADWTKNENSSHLCIVSENSASFVTLRRF